MRGKHIVLVGLMGSGKTSIGKRVAQSLGLPFIDSDEALERRTGRTAREILADQGTDALHAAEADVVEDALDSKTRSVIGAAASSVLTPATRDRLRQEYVVWLRADPRRLIERMASSDNDQRPYVDRDPDVLIRQNEERKDLYQEIASLVVDSTRGDKDELAEEIVAHVT
ncbi:MAG: shikimate kinase [Actinomycetota bacterium]|nr:shikimate kinase [Actinomycetota bacterium]